MWRGSVRYGLLCYPPFRLRCLNSRTITPFPHPAHRTGRAVLPHPALGQDITLSPTEGSASAQVGVPNPDPGIGTYAGSAFPRFSPPYASCTTTGGAVGWRVRLRCGTLSGQGPSKSNWPSPPASDSDVPPPFWHPTTPFCDVVSALMAATIRCTLFLDGRIPT